MNVKSILLSVCLFTLAVPHMRADVFKTDTSALRAIASSPAELLRGECSGVRVSALDGSPNGHLNVNIRGLNTLRGDSQPLWIVDGAVIGSSVNQNLNAFYLAGGKTINGDELPDYSGRSYASPIGNFGWLNPYEIASVEVVKDMSAAARYGMYGANGVIIIHTRKPSSGKRNIWLNSNVGAGIPSQKGEAFKTGILTSHDLGVNGVFGTNSYYNISGFVRYDNAAVAMTNSIAGGLTLALETVANERLQFGMDSRLAYGQNLSTSGTNFVGMPSTMMLARYPEYFKKDKLSSWLKSYEEEAFDYRTVNSLWLGVNLHKTLKLRLVGGIDYQNQTRLIWYGTGTSFGKEFKGATGVLNNTLLTANFSAELKFDRSFAVRHHLRAEALFDLNANSDRTNAMCGTDFDLPHLRGKGLSSSSSLHVIRKFNRKYSHMGGYAYLSYDYDGYAGLSGIMRLDYTSRFDSDPLWFPSGEAFVDLKRIFLKDSDVVSALRLSGGYGAAGRETVLPYEYMSAYIDDVPEVEKGSEPYFDGINRLMSQEYNVGLEASFLRGRYRVALKYYDKVTEDVFRMYNFGKVLSDMWVETENSQIHREWESSVANRGFEADASLNFIATKNIVWTARLNMAYNINSVVALDSDDVRKAGIYGGIYAAEFKQGFSVGQILEKNTLPKVSGGFGTTLSLYGVTLDADFSGAAGFHVINAVKMLERGLGKITQGDVERGDYLRLDCLTLSYDIPLKVRWIKGFKVNLSGHNLFTLTGYSGWNPDVNSFGVTVRSHGVDYGAFPQLRHIVLGVGFRF